MEFGTRRILGNELDAGGFYVFNEGVLREMPGEDDFSRFCHGCIHYIRDEGVTKLKKPGMGAEEPVLANLVLQNRPILFAYRLHDFFEEHPVKLGGGVQLEPLIYELNSSPFGIDVVFRLQAHGKGQRDSASETSPDEDYCLLDDRRKKQQKIDKHPRIRDVGPEKSRTNNTSKKENHVITKLSNKMDNCIVYLLGLWLKEGGSPGGHEESIGDHGQNAGGMQQLAQEKESIYNRDCNNHLNVTCCLGEFKKDVYSPSEEKPK
ncbi:hypothetical protein HWI79_921 [Cryptosporidium felis]|nr:hypothetical protein HWI79_921 [Cryptosporidium felis]